MQQRGAADAVPASGTSSRVESGSVGCGGAANLAGQRMDQPGKPEERCNRERTDDEKCCQHDTNVTKCICSVLQECELNTRANVKKYLTLLPV